MSIDMYLEAARTQAESLGRAVEQCLGQNLKLISVLSAFHNENELTGKAYDSAKNHVVGTVIPIVQGVILYQEAIALACQNFVSNYTAEVDGKSWRQSELEEKIRFAEQQLAELERKSQLYANNKGMSIVDFSASIAVAESARQVFQEILDNLLAFNESSPTIFAEAETYLAAASTGLSQAAQSWDTFTQTYLPPRRDADLSWKGTINTGWTKRQERIEETKSQQSFVKYIDELSFSEMEERYGKLISEYESYLNTGYNFPQRADLTAEQINYIYSRYQYLRAGGGAIYIESESSKKMKANLLASDKEEVDGMSLVELADKYPEFLRGRISIEFDYIFMSDEEKAKKDYSYVRFNQLMNAEPIDWRDPDYATKRNKYILETGKNPSTNEPATEAEIITAKNYGWVKAIPDTVAWTDMMVGSYVGHQVYNGKPVYGIDTNFAGELRNPIVSSQTVFGPQLPSKNWTPELPEITPVYGPNIVSEDWKPKLPILTEGNTNIPKPTFKPSMEIPVNERGYTKSSLKLGREVHKEYKASEINGSTRRKEFVLPSGRRVDFIDFENQTVYELKPNNPKQIKLGVKQLQGYIEEINAEFGGNWKGVLDTY